MCEFVVTQEKIRISALNEGCELDYFHVGLYSLGVLKMTTRNYNVGRATDIFCPEALPKYAVPFARIVFKLFQIVYFKHLIA